jgi:PAS domain-containing protein
VCVSIVDLTPRQTAEQTLGVLRRALDAIAEGVMVADLEQRPIFYNRAFERLSAQARG